MILQNLRPEKAQKLRRSPLERMQHDMPHATVAPQGREPCMAAEHGGIEHSQLYMDGDSDPYWRRTDNTFRAQDRRHSLPPAWRAGN